MRQMFDKPQQYTQYFLAAKFLKAEVVKSERKWKGILWLVKFDPEAIVKERSLASTSNFNIYKMLFKIHTSFSKFRESRNLKSREKFSFGRGTNKEPLGEVSTFKVLRFLTLVFTSSYNFLNPRTSLSFLTGGIVTNLFM